MEWMAWTLPTGVFFAGIAICLAVYSVLGVRAPSTPRRGFLPFATTRGDRLFVGLLASAFVNLAWAGLLDAPIFMAAVVWVPLMFVVGWRG